MVQVDHVKTIYAKFELLLGFSNKDLSLDKVEELLPQTPSQMPTRMHTQPVNTGENNTGRIHTFTCQLLCGGGFILITVSIMQHFVVG